MGGLSGFLLLTLLGASISGLVIAGIAKFLLPGKQRLSGIEMFIIGTGAAWIGGMIAGLFGLAENRKFGFDDVAVLVIQVAIAAIAIWLWTGFRNRQIKQAAVPGPPRDKDDKKGKDDKKDKDDDDDEKKGTIMPGPL